MKEIKLPDELIEVIRQYSGQEDSAKMQTAKVIAEYWDEAGGIIANHMNVPEGKAHRWFIESVSAQVGIHHASLYNRMRVGRNIVLRGYNTKHPELSFGAWLELLRNAPEEAGLVDDEVLDNRIEWMYNELDEKGSLPSTRTIKEHFRKNGKHPEWKEYWNAMVRNAKKFLETEYPEREGKIAKDFLWSVQDETQS